MSAMHSAGGDVFIYRFCNYASFLQR